MDSLKLLAIATHTTKGNADVLEPSRLYIAQRPNISKRLKNAPKDAASSSSSATAQAASGAPHKPSALHRLISYCSEGVKPLTPLQTKALEHIRRHAIVPADFESSYAYGPLSSFCYEERLVCAFENQLLELRASLSYDDVQFCTICGETDHWRCDCPHAF